MQNGHEKLIRHKFQVPFNNRIFFLLKQRALQGNLIWVDELKPDRLPRRSSTTEGGWKSWLFARCVAHICRSVFCCITLFREMDRKEDIFLGTAHRYEEMTRTDSQFFHVFWWVPLCKKRSTQKERWIRWQSIPNLPTKWKPPRCWGYNQNYMYSFFSPGN